MQTTYKQQIEAIQAAMQIRRRNVILAKENIDTDDQYKALNDAAGSIAAINLSLSFKELSQTETDDLRREIELQMTQSGATGNVFLASLRICKLLIKHGLIRQKTEVK